MGETGELFWQTSELIIVIAFFTILMQKFAGCLHNKYSVYTISIHYTL